MAQYGLNSAQFWLNSAQFWSNFSSICLSMEMVRISEPIRSHLLKRSEFGPSGPNSDLLRTLGPRGDRAAGGGRVARSQTRGAPPRPGRLPGAGTATAVHGGTSLPRWHLTATVAPHCHGGTSALVIEATIWLTLKCTHI